MSRVSALKWKRTATNEGRWWVVLGHSVRYLDLVALLEPEILPTHYLDLRNKVNINDNDKARTKKSSINKLLMSHREHWMESGRYQLTKSLLLGKKVSDIVTCMLQGSTQAPGHTHVHPETRAAAVRTENSNTPFWMELICPNERTTSWMLLHPSNFWPSAGPKHFPKKERWGGERTVGRAGKHTQNPRPGNCGLLQEEN